MSIGVTLVPEIPDTEIGLGTLDNTEAKRSELALVECEHFPETERVAERIGTSEHFVLELEGVLPVSSLRERRVTAVLRQRVLRTMLALLKTGDTLIFRFSGNSDRTFKWQIAGRLQCADQNRDQLEHGISAALRKLRYGYRFVPGSSAAEPQLHWRTRFRHPSEELCRIRSAGFGDRSPNESQLRLPSFRPTTIPRTFDSPVELVLCTSVASELIIEIQSICLTDIQIDAAASALHTLRGALQPLSDEANVLAQGQLLEQWLRDRTGYMISCELRADEPLAERYVRVVAGELLGATPACEETVDPSFLNLGDCVPSSGELPLLLPSPASLRDVRVRSVFNATPPSSNTAGPCLGIAKGQGERRINLPTAGRATHLFAIGGTGSGKSSFLAGLIKQDIEAGEGVALIDPHGDLYEQTLRAIPPNRADDVILFEPGRGRRVPGVNFLAVPEGPLRDVQVNFVVNEFLGIFEQLYDMRVCGGPMFQAYFRAALMLLIESRCPGATLLDLARVFEDRQFRDQLKAHCSDQQLVNFWTQQAERAGGEASLNNITPYITTKLNLFTQSTLIRPIVGQTKSTIDFHRLLSRRGILLINLSKGLLGDVDTRLLGMLMIGQIFSAALSRITLPAKQRVPFYLYVDEFQNFLTDSVAALVAEARKFGLHLSLANQTLGQLNANTGRESLAEAILGNVGNLILFRLGIPDAQRLRMFFEPDLTVEEIQRLPNYHAFARLMDATGPLEPFVFSTLPPPPELEDGNKTVARIRRGQARWARSKRKTEGEIAERLKPVRWPAAVATKSTNLAYSGRSMLAATANAKLRKRRL